jgi:sterol desaturase/sphingolipid hydroxylase (fatty acid hydroxylase superfamily)
MLMDSLLSLFDTAHEWLFEQGVQPVLFKLGLSSLTEDAYQGTMWLMIGVLQIVFLFLVFGALQKWRPVEPVLDRQQIRIDFFYTLIHRLRLFQLGLFFTLHPLWESLAGWAHVAGVPSFAGDQLWPGVTDQAWVSLLIYLLIFDAVDYFYHRAQHRYAWFWALHAVHHSQRQMTMWSDNRNHLLDSAMRDSVMVFVSLCIGVAPGQFVAIIIFTQLIESLSHANIRMHFGSWGERLLVSPRFHRKHHSIAFNESTAGPARGHNFAVLFPVWDLIFGTANFEQDYNSTGIYDQLESAGSRDYGQSLIAQQWLGIQRMLGRH